MLGIDEIRPNPRQPRRGLTDDDSKLLELSASIKDHGLLQPIVVTKIVEPENEVNAAMAMWGGEEKATQTTETATVKAPSYQIVAGERRWRAARLAGLTTVPVMIKDEDITSEDMLVLALIENIQRADLNPLEEAQAYQSLVQEFGLTQEAVARYVGKDRSTIANSLRLLQLAPKVREALLSQPDNFTEGHARALGGIAREEDQVVAMEKVVAEHLNVRQTEELANRIKTVYKEHSEAALKSAATTPPPPRRTEQMATLESDIRDALMVKVDLKYDKKGKGTLVLHFNNQDELEKLYSYLTARGEV
jgi:ParB family chromosome partitioning protein